MTTPRIRQKAGYRKRWVSEHLLTHARIIEVTRSATGNWDEPAHVLVHEPLSRKAADAIAFAHNRAVREAVEDGTGYV